ncbi:dihydrodipicolinate synthase family protein [Stackebrandtia nassauensis]|uniref:Dihydrodipicolinate synthetase n=1 Tax=Stackebrandtia nassauensis (strain DSM 44728 / CIP 108903 / NRRL B-16338 / NBRC 102104 / LLR-40K-21) TaxID=446470 RepID=D3Q1E3_STANL|nr:dihydrodipicolinate synthase family protein [Stackebrandtia nassauensis]ADD45723.1 dihydrodipicolinate synthetase [Stackebrandtia nassauensis DSM 44728]
MDFDLQGVIPPLATPLDADGEIDRASLESLIAFQLDAGVDGVFLGGSTGEVALLDARRQREVLDIARDAVDGAVPLLAGAIDTGTARVIDLARQAVIAGADAVVVTTPFYVKPNDTEIAEHFRRVAAAVDIPVIAYDIVSNAQSRITPDVVCELAESNTIAALKDSSGDLVTFREITRRLPDFPALTGSELLADVSLDLGAKGLVPGLGNIDPHGYVRLYRAARAGDRQVARAEQERLLDLFRIISVADRSRVGFTAGALGGFKAALALRNIIKNPATNPPLSPLTDAETTRIAEILAEAGLL